MSEGSAVDHDRIVKVNWFSINVPSMALILAVGTALWSSASGLSSKQERQDARLDAIEIATANAKSEADKRYETISVAIVQIPNITYRMAAAEQAIAASGQRMDSFADKIGDLRDGIAGLKTSIEVLTQRLESSFDLKKSEQ